MIRELMFFSDFAWYTRYFTHLEREKLGKRNTKTNDIITLSFVLKNQKN